MNKIPPKYPLRFFRWFCHPDYVEDIEGDLLERFEKRTNDKKAAKWLLAMDVLRLFRTGIVKNLEGTKRLNYYGMFINHLKISLRFLRNNKAFTLINFLGLTIGLLTCFFVLMYANFELSHDSYHNKKDNIYRLVTDVNTSGGINRQSSSIPMGPAIKESFPQVVNYTRIGLDYMIVQSDPETYMTENIAYTDASTFSIFTFPVTYGNPKTFFNTPYDAVVSESAAIKYFGTTDCIGERLTLDGSTAVYVVGVMKDIPRNSHFRTDIFLSTTLLTEIWNPSRKSNWRAFNTYTYLLLEDQPDILTLSQRITDLVAAHIDRDDTEYNMSLEPLKSLYMYADPRGYRTGTSSSGDIDSIYMLVIVAVFVLFIAGFNFVNLSTALSLNRAKEISMRKVLGTSKLQMTRLLLWDAVLFSLIAYVAAVILFLLVSPFFNQLTGRQIDVQVISHLREFGWLLCITISMGAFSGIYPAFFLSGLNPIDGLKGGFTSKVKGVALRRVLVSIQFFFSVLLIAFTFGVYEQLQFVRNTDLGYSRSNKLILDYYFDEKIKENQELVREELLKIPAISQVSFSSCVPGKTNRRFITKIQSKSGEIEKFEADLHWIDTEYLNQYDINLVAGRSFQKILKSDIKNTMVLNETAVKELGYQNPEEVLGKHFDQGGRWKGIVIGVVEDFHNFSLKEEISPMTFQYNPSQFGHTFVTLTVSNQNISHTIAKLKDKWNDFNATRPFTYFLADQTYQALYEAEDRFGKIILYLSGIAILISSLGLVGLSAFSTVRRAKEIGIRKTLGASPKQLLQLVSKEFLILVFYGLVIGIPVSVFALSTWLDNFAYHTQPDWSLIAATIVVTIITSVLAIGSQVAKVALANPIDSLRDE